MFQVIIILIDTYNNHKLKIHTELEKYDLFVLLK